MSNPRLKEPAMTITVEAVYENGMLRPVQPLPLKEHDRVQLTIQPPLPDIAQAYGMMGWEGDAETLRRIALDPEFLPEEDS
jgi:predicted DNA-binding antitoxin AbrB/MazE fold protein